MASAVATVASADAFTLAEGPLWDATRERVLWVDIPNGHVLEGRLRGDAIDLVAQTSFDTMVGAVVVADDGRLLVAAQEKLIVVRPTGERGSGPRIVAAGIASRTNDGATDPQGRFLIGTLALDDRVNQEVLVRVEDDGRVTTIDDDLGLSNGLAWSPDGSLLYSIDTKANAVWVRTYEPHAIGKRRQHLVIDGGHPDGMCMDTDGCLWIAIWGGGEVRRYAPDGRALAVVRVPAPHTSSVAFVGPARDLLLITTAQKDLTPDQLEQYPDSGHLFTARVDAIGVPTTPWSASWSPLATT